MVISQQAFLTCFTKSLALTFQWDMSVYFKTKKPFIIKERQESSDNQQKIRLLWGYCDNTKWKKNTL